MTKWYQYISSASEGFTAYYITGQWGKFITKSYTMLTHLIYFLGFWLFVFGEVFRGFFVFVFVVVAVVFQHKICVFIVFSSFFDEGSNFHNRKLTNQDYELVVSNCQHSHKKQKYSLEIRAVDIEITGLCWNLACVPSHRGSFFKKHGLLWSR